MLPELRSLLRCIVGVSLKLHYIALILHVSIQYGHLFPVKKLFLWNEEHVLTGMYHIKHEF